VQTLTEAYPRATFPAEIKKTPFLALIGVFGMLGCLSGILSGCLSDEGTSYDVPLRSRVQSASLQIAADGTPYVLAAVGMNYGTRENRSGWEPLYQTLNVQSILYSFESGAWKAFPFRNLNNPNRGDGSSYLLRNDKGGIQPLISNRKQVTLYARSGGAWIPRSSAVDPRVSGNFPPVNSTSEEFLLQGDSAWRTLSYDYGAEKLGVFSNTGGMLPLDSGLQTVFLGFLRGSRRDFLIGYAYQPPSSTSDPLMQHAVPHLLAYSWGREPGHAGVRKQTLLIGASFYAYFSGQVMGETRFYVRRGSDTLSAFALRGDSIIALADVDPEAVGNQKGDSRVGTYSFGMDPDGCYHSLQSFSDSEHSADTGDRLHFSSCASGADTLILPKTDLYLRPNLSNLRFSKDGKPMILMTRSLDTDPYQNADIGPSGIYMATLEADRKWRWETIVEF
jgi:hypothetical protein